LIVLLAGCAGTDAASTGSDPGVQRDIAVGAPGAVTPETGTGEMAADGSAAMGAPASAATTIDRQVVRTGYVAIRVDDVLGATGQVRALVARDHGIIAAEDTQVAESGTTSSMTVQVPAASLDRFLTDLADLGRVENVNVSTQDVTSQVVDLDARIDALATSVDRLTAMLADASRMEDLLAIETQLSQRQAELDALKQQRTWLADQVAMSTVTVSLIPTSAPVTTPGFVGGLQSGWNAFVTAIASALTALGFLLPFLVVALIAAGIVVFIVLRLTRRHPAAARAQTAEPAAEPAAAQSSPSIDG
jgi:hypothetical protein